MPSQQKSKKKSPPGEKTAKKAVRPMKAKAKAKARKAGRTSKPKPKPKPKKASPKSKAKPVAKSVGKTKGGAASRARAGKPVTKKKAAGSAARAAAKGPRPSTKPAPKVSKKKSAKVRKAAAPPTPEKARRIAEQLVSGLMRELLATRRRNYRLVFALEKKYYAKPLWEESRRTYTRYLEAEQRERLLKSEVVAPETVHVYTSGEGLGKNRYTCARLRQKEWQIVAVDVLCEECSGSGACRWCEGKGCLDCQQSGRCVACSGGGWTKWAK